MCIRDRHREPRAVGDLGGVRGGGGLHEAGAVHVVLVVGVLAGVRVAARRRVLHAYRRRLVPGQDAGDRLYRLVLGVRGQLLDRGAGGRLDAERGYLPVPQAAQAVRVLRRGVAGLAQLEPDQVDLGPGDEDVELGEPAAQGGYDGALPRAGAVAGGHLGVGGADAVLPGLRVVGAVGGLLRVPGGGAVGLVAAVGLAGGQVDGGERGAGRQGAAEVGVHEEQVVVGVGDDLDDRPGRDARRECHGRVLLLGGLGRRLLARGDGEHAGGTDGEHGKQGREEEVAAGNRHRSRLGVVPDGRNR